jgi:hypothetical protein
MGNHLQNARILAELMDNKFSLFGIKFGIDPILGFLPLIGDFITVFVKLYFIWIAFQLKIDLKDILKIICISFIDFFAGLLPIIGDLADIKYKSCEKIYNILLYYFAKKQQ